MAVVMMPHRKQPKATMCVLSYLSPKIPLTGELMACRAHCMTLHRRRCRMSAFVRQALLRLFTNTTSHCCLLIGTWLAFTTVSTWSLRFYTSGNRAVIVRSLRTATAAIVRQHLAHCHHGLHPRFEGSTRGGMHVCLPVPWLCRG